MHINWAIRNLLWTFSKRLLYDAVAANTVFDSCVCHHVICMGFVSVGADVLLPMTLQKKKKTPRIFPQHIILPNTTVYSHCRNDFLFKNVLFCSMAATKMFFIENWPLNYELKYFWWRKNERFSLLVVSLSSEPFNLFYSAAIFMCGVRSYFIHISLGHSHIHLYIWLSSGRRSSIRWINKHKPEHKNTKK